MVGVPLYDRAEDTERVFDNERGLLLHRRDEELTHVHGIGPKTTEKVKPWLNLNSSGDEPVEKLERKPVPTPSLGKGTKIGAAEAKIDVNLAVEAELMRLPGVGPTLAARIVQYRANAPFASIDDLRKVKGIGAKTLDAIRPFLVATVKK